jgi:hypothetical protein
MRNSVRVPPTLVPVEPSAFSRGDYDGDFGLGGMGDAESGVHYEDDMDEGEGEEAEEADRPSYRVYREIEVWGGEVALETGMHANAPAHADGTPGGVRENRCLYRSVFVANAAMAVGRGDMDVADITNAHVDERLAEFYNFIMTDPIAEAIMRNNLLEALPTFRILIGADPANPRTWELWGGARAVGWEAPINDADLALYRALLVHGETMLDDRDARLLAAFERRPLEILTAATAAAGVDWRIPIPAQAHPTAEHAGRTPIRIAYVGAHYVPVVTRDIANEVGVDLFEGDTMMAQQRAEAVRAAARAAARSARVPFFNLASIGGGGAQMQPSTGQPLPAAAAQPAATLPAAAIEADPIDMDADLYALEEREGGLQVGANPQADLAWAPTGFMVNAAEGGVATNMPRWVVTGYTTGGVFALPALHNPAAARLPNPAPAATTGSTRRDPPPLLAGGYMDAARRALPAEALPAFDAFAARPTTTVLTAEALERVGERNTAMGTLFAGHARGAMPTVPVSRGNFGVAPAAGEAIPRAGFWSHYPVAAAHLAGAETRAPLAPPGGPPFAHPRMIAPELRQGGPDELCFTMHFAEMLGNAMPDARLLLHGDTFPSAETAWGGVGGVHGRGSGINGRGGGGAILARAVIALALGNAMDMGTNVAFLMTGTVAPLVREVAANLLAWQAYAAAWAAAGGGRDQRPARPPPLGATLGFPVFDLNFALPGFGGTRTAVYFPAARAHAGGEPGLLVDLNHHFSTALHTPVATWRHGDAMVAALNVAGLQAPVGWAGAVANLALRLGLTAQEALADPGHRFTVAGLNELDRMAYARLLLNGFHPMEALGRVRAGDGGRATHALVEGLIARRGEAAARALVDNLRRDAPAVVVAGVRDERATRLARLAAAAAAGITGVDGEALLAWAGFVDGGHAVNALMERLIERRGEAAARALVDNLRRDAPAVVVAGVRDERATRLARLAAAAAAGITAVDGEALLAWAGLVDGGHAVRALVERLIERRGEAAARALVDNLRRDAPAVVVAGVRDERATRLARLARLAAAAAADITAVDREALLAWAGWVDGGENHGHIAQRNALRDALGPPALDTWTARNDLMYAVFATMVGAADMAVAAQHALEAAIPAIIGDLANLAQLFVEMVNAAPGLLHACARRAIAFTDRERHSEFPLS